MPRRQRSTWGSITRLGKERYRLRWWEDVDGEYARRSEVLRGSRRAAERRLAEIRSSLDETAPHGRRRARRKLTVGEAYERWWLPDAEARVRAGRLAKQTLDGYQSKWRVYVAPRWADVPCADVRPLDIQTWLEPITQKPAVDSLALLRQTLDFATTYEVVGENVARRPYRMPDAHKDLSDGAYTLDELDAIAQAARESCCEAAVLLMSFGSCRTGESLGVRVDQVSRVTSHGLELTTAEVVRQVNSDATISADGVLKNRQSVRTVVVPPRPGETGSGSSPRRPGSGRRGGCATTARVATGPSRRTGSARSGSPPWRGRASRAGCLGRRGGRGRPTCAGTWAWTARRWSR